MAGYYELKLAKDGQFHFQLLAGNGQVILSSEMYKSREAALNGIASVQGNCAEDTRFECKQATNGKPFFLLKAANHQVIGQSQMYSSEDSCAKGIESVKRHGVTTEIRDLSAG